MLEIYIRTLHALINDVANNNEIIEQLKLIATNTELDFSLIVGKKVMKINEVIELIEISTKMYSSKIENDLLQLYSEVERYYNYFGKQYYIK